MRAERLSDLYEFLPATEAWRAANPLTTNLLSTIAINAASGARFIEHLEGWIVRDDEVVIGAGLRADPYEFNIGPMPLEAARMLGAELVRSGSRIKEARGSAPVVQAFAEGAVDASGGALNAGPADTGEGLYELGELLVPDVEGSTRRAVDDDLELVTQWIVEFARDAGVASHEPGRRAQNYVARGSMLLWEVNDVPVAMAGRAPIVTAGDSIVGRIGPVFTPAAQRRRGYGAAVTAAASAIVRQKGARVMLFTDLANPTSNAIYQRLGFELVDSIRTVAFS